MANGFTVGGKLGTEKKPLTENTKRTIKQMDKPEKPEKLATQGTQDTRGRQSQKKHTTIYTQTHTPLYIHKHTNNVNKTCNLLQTIAGKDKYISK